MKKLFSIISVLVTILVLSACKEADPVYIEVPGPTEYVEVVKEVEVEVPVVETEIVTEVVTEYVEVPINVEYERFYKPGVYLNHTKVNDEGVYTYVVVVVDEYGKISGIMFDDTKSTSEFYKDDNDKLYVFIEGDGKTVPHTYRYIPSDTPIDEYPTARDAITADDLVMGIHQNRIETLDKIQTNETSRILGEEWVEDTDLLAQKIIEDQTTFGINLYKSGNEVTTTNVAGVELTNVDLYLNLVQEILNNDASEPNLDELKTTPRKGLYTPGGMFGYSERIVGDSIYYYTSFVVVDEFGKIAGVYNDATCNGYKDDEHATRWILEEDYDMDENSDIDWYLQAKAFGQAVTRNQGVDGFTLYTDKSFEEETTVPEYSDGQFIFEHEDQDHVYTKQIPGTEIGVEGMIAATKDAVSKLNGWKLEDGTYFVAADGEDNHSFVTVTIEDNKIESIFLDSTEGTDHAEVYRDDEWLSLYKFDRTWIDTANDQHTKTILVYKDGRDYHSLYDIIIDGDRIDADEEIDFEDDEENTLEPISGYNTLMILGERYGLSDVSDTGEWNEQIQRFTKYFEGKENPYDINMDNGYTDTIAGVSIEVSEYHQLIVDALLLAQDSGNALMKDQVVSSSAPRLANGTYFAFLEPNEDGEQPFAFMSVQNSEIQSIVYDCTTTDGDLITTKLSLGDDYGLKKSKNDLEWYEQSVKISEEIIDNQDDIIEDIEEGYDYTDDYDDSDFGEAPYRVPDTSNPDEFDLDLENLDGITIDVNDFKDLTDKLIHQALYALVEERANEILDSIIDGEEPLVSLEDYEHGLTDDLQIGSDVNNVFEIDWDTSDNDVFDVDEGSDYIVVEELDKNEKESLTLTLTYDREEYSREVEFTALTQVSAEVNLIEERIEDRYTDLKIVEDYDYELNSIDCEYIDADWYWYDEDDDRIYSTEDLSVGDHTLTLKLEYEEDEFVKREINIEIVDLDDAYEDVIDNLKPGNIIHNGDVTEEGIVTLPIDSGYKGITITWEMDVDSDADGIDFDDENELTIHRTYDNEKVVLTATINNGVNTDKEILRFEFRVLAADEQLVEERINKILNERLNDPETILPDPIVDTKLAEGSDNITVVDLDAIVEEEDFVYDDPDIDWVVKDKYGNNMSGISEYNRELRVTDPIEGEATLILDITVDIDGDNEADVEVERTFEIDLFISNTIVN